MPGSSRPRINVKPHAKVLKALLPRPWEECRDPLIDREYIDRRVIETICAGLLAGQVGILPTETVYGIMGSALDEAAVERIYAVKGREAGKPLAVQVSSAQEAPKLGLALNAFAQALAREFWPGPLTLVLPFLGEEHCRWKIAPALSRQWAKKKTVAVRIPDNPLMQMVLKSINIPLVATSANISGQEPMTRGNMLDKTLRDKVDWVVDGGTTLYQCESSVVLCDHAGWRILREGALRGSVIDKALRPRAGCG